MMPATTNAAGQCMANPDVCLTPAGPAGQIPVPYPNIAMLNQAKKTSTKVLFVNKEVVTLKSEIPKSMGDEAGTGKGVISGTNMGKVLFKSGSSKVKVEGQPCICQTSPSGGNGVNANAPPGLQVAPSQTKVLIVP